MINCTIYISYRASISAKSIGYHIKGRVLLCFQRKEECGCGYNLEHSLGPLILELQETGWSVVGNKTINHRGKDTHIHVSLSWHLTIAC